MDNRSNTYITTQLNSEIDKLKEQDYTSYQNFYNETAQYLYGLIWDMVQDQNTANVLLNNLYTDIYASIATELADNSQFYVWAGNKVQQLTTAYLEKHGLAGEQDDGDNCRRMEGAVAAATTNVGIDVAAETCVAGGTAATVAGEVGMGSAASGAGQAGIGTASGVSGVGTVAGTGIVSGVAHVGLSMGAKIAISVATAALAVGGGIGVYKYVDEKKNDTPQTTEITTEVATTLADVEETTEVAVTTEQVEKDDKVDRYTAYYEVAKSYMEKYPTEVTYSNWGGDIEGFSYAKLMDLNHDGKDQLLLVYHDVNDYPYFVGNSNYNLSIYDYIDGELVLKSTLSGLGRFGICNIDDTHTAICTFAGDDFDEATYSLYEYIDGDLVRTHEYSETREHVDLDVYDSFFSIDGEAVDKDTYMDKISAIECYYMWNRYEAGAWNELNFVFIKPLLEKHRTIMELAKVSGDEAFVDIAGEPEYNVSQTFAEWYYEITVTTETNKYNERYYITCSSENEAKISLDGKTFQIVAATQGHDFCMSYIEDVVVAVGGNSYQSIQDANGEWETVDFWFWLTPDDYMVVAEDTVGITDFLHCYNLYPDYQVTEEEYNTKVNELMTRQ